jgi:hypothetical protein
MNQIKNEGSRNWHKPLAGALALSIGLSVLAGCGKKTDPNERPLFIADGMTVSEVAIVLKAGTRLRSSPEQAVNDDSGNTSDDHNTIKKVPIGKYVVLINPAEPKGGDWFITGYNKTELYVSADACNQTVIKGGGSQHYATAHLKTGSQPADIYPNVRHPKVHDDGITLEKGEGLVLTIDATQDALNKTMNTYGFNTEFSTGSCFPDHETDTLAHVIINH